jgi:hypothetical protein
MHIPRSKLSILVGLALPPPLVRLVWQWQGRRLLYEIWGHKASISVEWRTPTSGATSPIRKKVGKSSRVRDEGLRGRCVILFYPSSYCTDRFDFLCVPGDETHEGPGGQAGPESDGRVVDPCVQRTALESGHRVRVFAAPSLILSQNGEQQQSALANENQTPRDCFAPVISFSEPAKGVTRVTREQHNDSLWVILQRFCPDSLWITCTSTYRTEDPSCACSELPARCLRKTILCMKCVLANHGEWSPRCQEHRVLGALIDLVALQTLLCN